MQAKGSLSQTDLRSLLEEAQSERATGTLSLRDGESRSVTLFFLFGHLFHATAEGSSGDEVVLRALSWQRGEFDFDAKAKLPADETVRSSVPDLVQRSMSPEAAPEPEPRVQPPAPEQATAPPASGPSWAQAPAPAAMPPPPPMPLSAPPPPQPVETEPESDPEPPRGVKHRPSPKHGREPFPVPAGQVLYDSLKTSFVDFPRLITTLERETYTGYVRLLTDNAAGLIFFREGVPLECVYDAGAEPNLLLGRQALREFNDEVTRGHGVLDVVSLSKELVDGLHQLTVARPVYTELYASWVNMEGLIKFLEEKGLSGSLMVRGQGGTGVIILDHGRLAGAYTSDSREISDSADRVLEICSDPGAMIEVKAEGDARRDPLEVDEVVGIRRQPARVAAPPGPPAVSRLPLAVAPEPAPAPAHDPGPTFAPPLPASPATSHLGPPPTDSNPGAIDWEAVAQDLQQLTDEALGNRSRKVKDVLAGAPRSQAGLEGAIDQIPSISILFVDSSRLDSLATDLRNRLRSHLQ